MNLHVISTGSKGNCYLLTDDQGRVIALDAGVSIKGIVSALSHDIRKFDGALITHEHQDHCRGVVELERIGIPCYLSKGTYEVVGGIASVLPLTSDGNFDTFRLGNWNIRPFSVQHDAADAVGFLISNNAAKILYATDTFYLRYKFNGLTHIIIECNYCKATLMSNVASGKISNSRQNRLMHSHFSLENLLKYLSKIDLDRCIIIVLVHLSDSNSDEKMMIDAVRKQTGIKTIAADDGMDINFDLF